jgi:hypothetical protein
LFKSVLDVAVGPQHRIFDFGNDSQHCIQVLAKLLSMFFELLRLLQGVAHFFHDTFLESEEFTADRPAEVLKLLQESVREGIESLFQRFHLAREEIEGTP